MKLVFKNIFFERNQKIILNNMSGELQPHELLIVQGANGSGKSTLLRVLAGLIEPQSGSVLYSNDDKTQLHYVGHQNAIKNQLTVFENIKLYAALFSKKLTAAQIQIVLQKIGLVRESKMKTEQLSAGQCRRLSLAKLLLNPLPLWVLDEPTTALDSDAQIFLEELLNDHLAQGGMAIVATHHSLTVKTTNKFIFLGEKNVG